MIIFDCDDFQVIQRNGKTDFLLVTFSSLGMFTEFGSMANGKLFWGQKLAEAHNYSAIGFVAKRRHWFCSGEMHSATLLVAEVASSFSAVVAYGSSMGGYASLRWGRQSGASTVLAFAPQYSIDPEVVSRFDRRFEYAFEPDVHSNMDIQTKHFADKNYIFVDRKVREDNGHIDLIKRKGPHVEVIPLNNCSHECIRIFASTVYADQLINLSIAGDSEKIRALAGQLRRRAPIRAFVLANKMIGSRNETAVRIYEKYNKYFESFQKEELLNRLKIGVHSMSNGISPEKIDNVMNENKKSRIVHIHIPKTAGTALRTAFENEFKGQLRVFPEWDETKYAGVMPDEFDFYSGHIGFETASRLGGDIVTVLRHPVDRFISVYYFWRQLFETGKERSINTQLASKFSLDEFAQLIDQPGLIEEFHNRCTLQIAYGSSLKHRRDIRLQGLNDDDVFNLALNNIKLFKVVGIQEKIGMFADRIENTFGVSLNIEKINVTQGREEVSSISISTRRRIQRWVYMDMELYQEALRWV
jgi:hypothetical protein